MNPEIHPNWRLLGPDECVQLGDRYWLNGRWVDISEEDDYWTAEAEHYPFAIRQIGVPTVTAQEQVARHLDPLANYLAFHFPDQA